MGAIEFAKTFKQPGKLFLAKNTENTWFHFCSFFAGSLFVNPSGGFREFNKT